MRSSWIRVMLVFGAASAAAAAHASAAEAPPDKRAFGLEDLYRVVDLAGLDRSPDGRALYYDVRSYDLPRAKDHRDLWTVPAAGGEARRLTWTEEASEHGPIASPDGRSLAFLSDRAAKGVDQLWILPTAGGEARALTDFPAGVSDPLWSPDGARLAFVAKVWPECGADAACNRELDAERENGPSKAHVADDLLYRHWTEWGDGKVDHVLTVEVDGGKVRDLTPGDHPSPVFDPSGGVRFAFSPDGKELCFTRNPEPLARLAWSTNSDLWVVPVAPDESGSTRPARDLTASNPAFDGWPQYSPDGRFIAYLRQSVPGYESDRFVLTLLDRATGEIRALSDAFDDWVLDFRWLPDSSGLVFRGEFEGRTPLYRVGVAGGAVRKVADFATIDAWVLSPDGREAYAIRRAVGAPREVFRFDLEGGGEPVRLTTHNLALEREVDIRPAESVKVPGADGKPVQMFLVKPHGFDPGKKYPVILNVHGGPQSQWTDAFRGDWQVYPGSGYVVAFPNPHGSTGFGQAYTEEISGDWGGKVFEDLMKVTDWLADQPWVDADRMGAMGWSFGGYMMNWFEGHTDRFRAIATMMGLFDLRTFDLSTEELWFPEWDLGGVPWKSDLYERWSPSASIASFKTPLLVITGEKDFRVPYSQGLMAFTAARRRGIPARLIVLPESGHWPGWYDMALYYTAHLDWFHRWLGGPPPPWAVEDFVYNRVFDPVTGARIDRK